MKKEDKRKFPRLSFEADVRYDLVRGQSRKERESPSRNISAGGICMMITDKIRAGTLLSLEFSLPREDRPITAKGRVAWSAQLSIYSGEPMVSYDCGIEFVDISPEDREKISRHVITHIR
jgi:c-di-GMP-binding flagellar brake protein YcgR